MNYNFRLLKANEIDCRVGTINERGFTLLLYKDARVDMNILDETVGQGNWQRDHKAVKDNLYCGVSLWDDDKKQWITKWDCGVESNTEKEKGEASDSFKRACVNVGIGRELYTSPFIYIKGNVDKNEKGKLSPAFKKIKVGEIGYNTNREINKLVILGDGETIYSFGASKSERTNNPQSAEVEKAKRYECNRRPLDTYTDEQLDWMSKNAKNEDVRKYSKILLDSRNMQPI